MDILLPLSGVIYFFGETRARLLEVQGAMCTVSLHYLQYSFAHHFKSSKFPVTQCAVVDSSDSGPGLPPPHLCQLSGSVEWNIVKLIRELIKFCEWPLPSDPS